MDYNSKKDLFESLFTQIFDGVLYCRFYDKIAGKYYSKETYPAQLMQHLKPSKLYKLNICGFSKLFL